MNIATGGSSLKQKTVSGLYWRSFERFCVQGVDLLVSVILARILGPEPYGLVALLAVFLSISRILLDCGFGKALIQQKEISDLDCSTIFLFNLGFAFVMYAILFFSARSISNFYGEPQLTLLLRVIAGGLLFKALNDVQQSLIVRNMDFRLSFRISISQNLTHGIVGVGLALAGAGVWALVCSSLLGRFVGTMVRWRAVSWRPSLRFSFSSFRRLFSYSWKLMLSSLMGSLTGNLSSLLIGRLHSSTELAFYRKGQTFPNAFVAIVNGPVSSVSFTALAKLQNDVSRFRSAVRKMLSGVSYLVTPAMGFFAGVTPAFVRIVLGERWMPAVPFMQLACFTGAFGPVTIVNLQAITSFGRSGTALKLEAIKKLIALSVIVLVLPRGVMAYAVAITFISTPLSAVLNAFPNYRILHYGVRQQFLDLMPALTLAAVLFGAETLLGRATSTWHPFPTLVVQTVLGLLIFVSAGLFFRPPGWFFLLDLLKPVFARLRSIRG